jgi:hypothetical protein
MTCSRLSPSLQTVTLAKAGMVVIGVEAETK